MLTSQLRKIYYNIFFSKAPIIINFLAKSRKSSTDGFLSRLSFLKNSCSSASCLFSQKLSSLPSLHFQCHERILEIFDKIERILNFEKTSFFVENQFLLEKRRTFLENRISELREIGEEAEKWESDIIQNYEKIVEKIEMMPFREIMGRYEEKIKGFEETLGVVKQDLKLNFEDFLTISEIGIEKIETLLKGIFTFKNEKPPSIEEVPNRKLNKENLEIKENKIYENKENINSTMENKLLSRPPLLMNKALSTLIGKNKNWKKSNEDLVRTSKNVGGDSFKNITSLNLNFMKKN